MPDLKLHYFDFNGGRGEVARLAMWLGRIEFDDQRIPLTDWPAQRDAMPFKALPVLEVDGELISQSNAINRYIGKLSGLYPDDRLEALRCDEVMDAVEDVVTQVVLTFVIEYAGQPIIPGLWARLSTWCVGDTLVAHHMAFDRSWIVKNGLSVAALEEHPDKAELLALERDFVANNHYVDILSKAFAIARINYGRADFPWSTGACKYTRSTQMPITGLSSACCAVRIQNVAIANAVARSRCKRRFSVSGRRAIVKYRLATRGRFA